MQFTSQQKQDYCLDCTQISFKCQKNPSKFNICFYQTLVLLLFCVVQVHPRLHILELWRVFSLMFEQKKVTANEMVTQKTVQEALDILRGAVTIVYPMGLPPHENVKMELENNEDLSGTQVAELTSFFFFFLRIFKPQDQMM